MFLYKKLHQQAKQQFKLQYENWWADISFGRNNNGKTNKLKG